MKKILSLILVLVTLACFSGCKNKNIVKSGTIPETVKVSVIDNDNKNWLDNSHFEKVNLKIGKDDAYYLELITNDSGKALLKEASEENLGKDLSLIIDEVFLLSVSVPKPIKNGVFKCESKNIDQIYSYNLLTDAPIKTEGLIPPGHLITEEKAKTVAFERTTVNKDAVTDLEIRLEFDESWRGWEYQIKFSENNITYECEINATFGNIIKFNTTKS